MIKQFSKLTVLVLTLIFFGFANAQSLSVEQIKQAKIKIKTLQQQDNYYAADQLINALIKQDPDNPAFYFDLALNYFYNNQPIQAEQTLKYVFENKDLSAVPKTVLDNVEVFYKKVSIAADNKRKSKNSNTANEKKLSVRFGAKLESGYNDNLNLFPTDVESTTVSQESSIFNNLTLTGNLKTKNMPFANQAFNINQSVYAKFDSNRIDADNTEMATNLSYKLETSFLVKDSMVDAHKYPVSFSYYNTDEYSVTTISFSPNIRLLNDHRLGYTYNFNLQNYTDQGQDVSESGNVHSGYYIFSKGFKFKFNPSLYTKLNVTTSNGLSDYLRFDAYLSSIISINKSIKLTQSYQFKTTEYALEENETVNRSDVEHKTQTKISYYFNKQFYIGGEYQFKMRNSNEAVYQYNQSLFVFNLAWSK